jgi:hypothetical protein
MVVVADPTEAVAAALTVVAITNSNSSKFYQARSIHPGAGFSV